MGFPQRLLADDEELKLVLRKHVKVLIGPAFVLVLVVAAVGVPAALRGADGPLWLWLAVVAVATLIVLRWVVWPWLVWWTTVYAITTRRLILRSGVFNRQGHDMPLTRLNDVSFEHTFVERLLGAGSLVVESAGERGQLHLTDIPKVELVQRTLYRLADDLRPRGSGHAIDSELDRELDEEFGDDRYRGNVPNE